MNEGTSISLKELPSLKMYQLPCPDDITDMFIPSQTQWKVKVMKMNNKQKPLKYDNIT